MIHVLPAKFSNEQNLICFQLHNQIYYTAIQDIDVGDILKVWYAPKYAAKMNTKLLSSSPFEIVNNVLKQASMGTLDSFVEDSLNQQILSSCDNHNRANNNKTADVSLPPINSLMRTPSLNFYQNNNYLGYSNDYNSHHYSESEPMKYFEPTDIEMNLPSHVDNFNNLAINQCPDLTNFTIDSSNMFSNDAEEIGGSAAMGGSGIVGDMENEGGAGIDENELANSNANLLKNSKKKLVDKGEKNPRLKPAAFCCKLCNKTYVAICNLNKHHMQVHNLHLCNLCMKVSCKL